MSYCYFIYCLETADMLQAKRFCFIILQMTTKLSWYSAKSMEQILDSLIVNVTLELNRESNNAINTDARYKITRLASASVAPKRLATKVTLNRKYI